MNAVDRLFRVVSGYGIRGALFKLYAAFVDRWFDFRYGVDTCRWATLDTLHIVGANKAHGHRYEPARIVVIRQLLRKIRPLVPPESVVVDLGSGKGRVLLIAAECGFTAATGVEFASELCETSRENCLIYQRKTKCAAQFRIVEGDVVDYDIGEHDNVFVLFNPFDDLVMAQVIARLKQSLSQYPRRVLVCMYNMESVNLMSRTPGFIVIDASERYGYRTTVFSNTI
jgi:SAM-dependent methyltransferase